MADTDRLDGHPAIIPPRLRSLRHGCYLLRFMPKQAVPRLRYDGTLRIERDGSNTIASGDLYLRRLCGRLADRDCGPNPASGIPIFPRARYRYYLSITQILENITFGDQFTLGFERFRFNSAGNTWTSDGMFSAQMKWEPAPSGYPGSNQYLEGEVKDATGVIVGRMTMGWVSPYLRRATFEIDRVADSQLPLDNGGGIDWQAAFEPVGWQLDVDLSNADVVEPSGEFWSDAELHQAMLARRDSADLDNEWRYHLLCVRRLDSTSRGIMYDAGATDSNNVPREGAAIASHWRIPPTSNWGSVAGMLFGEATAPYFRTAVHELGHAFGLRHNTVNNGFMNTTNTIAGNPGMFPNNILWAFAPDDAKRLRHMPDAWVRPGMIPWAPSYTDPLSPNDGVDGVYGLELIASSLSASVPLGAPVRINLQLRNISARTQRCPGSLGLGAEFVSGTVTDPSGVARTFRSLFRCIEEAELVDLPPGEALIHDLTLLRGAEGALFGGPGLHQIQVRLDWEQDGERLAASAEASVLVEAASSEGQAEAARTVLDSPDLLLTLALGGDHLPEGRTALDAALDDATLRPHYAVVEAKRRGRRFGDRPADVESALSLIDESTVMSGSEVKRVAEIVQKTRKAERKSGSVKQVIDQLKDRLDSTNCEQQVADMVEAL
jgi:hypothetical protein